MPAVSLGIDLQPILHWATWFWGEIDIAVYLIAGTSLAFYMAKQIKNIFV